jgi:ergothioneine biosynthesis protein EgtB
MYSSGLIRSGAMIEAFASNTLSAPTGHADDFQRVRSRTLELAAPLAPEDAAAQSMPDASPAKWHLAHTTWFFEQFVLGADASYRPWRPEWAVLFNSYYVSAGPRHPRAARGLLTRPNLDDVIEYRGVVDRRMAELMAAGVDAGIRARIELGLQHEQQHQELLLTDIKHLFSLNPLQPVYRPRPKGSSDRESVPMQFLPGRAGEAWIGHSGSEFAFDCETPAHAVLLTPHAMANRPVNNGEFLEFIRDGGYRTPQLWMSEGWSVVEAERWRGPLYWSEEADSEFTLAGRCALDPLAPVCHISYYEADAYARWAGARLPTEAEWEVFARDQAAAAPSTAQGNDAGSNIFHPQPPTNRVGALQLRGDVWEWTASPYVPYPRFAPLPGALGEYNGKFMCGQWVLRGGSCATPSGHLRPSYRNFFYPRDRWQFMGLRLARDC